MKTIKEFVADHLEYIAGMFKGKQTKAQILENVDKEIDEFFDGLKALFKTVVRQIKKDDIQGFITSSFKTIGGVVPSKVKDERLKKTGFSFDFGPIHIHSGKDRRPPVPPVPPPPPHHRPGPPTPPPPTPRRRPAPPKPRAEVKKAECNGDCNCDNCKCDKNKKGKK